MKRENEDPRPIEELEGDAVCAMMGRVPLDSNGPRAGYLLRRGDYNVIAYVVEPSDLRGKLVYVDDEDGNDAVVYLRLPQRPGDGCYTLPAKSLTYATDAQIKTWRTQCKRRKS